jgi:hypothetical protein
MSTKFIFTEPPCSPGHWAILTGDALDQLQQLGELYE